MPPWHGWCLACKLSSLYVDFNNKNTRIRILVLSASQGTSGHVEISVKCLRKVYRAQVQACCDTIREPGRLLVTERPFTIPNSVTTPDS